MSWIRYCFVDCVVFKEASGYCVTARDDKLGIHVSVETPQSMILEKFVVQGVSLTDAMKHPEVSKKVHAACIKHAKEAVEIAEKKLANLTESMFTNPVYKEDRTGKLVLDTKNLTARFLTLPFRFQMDVANKLKVLPEENCKALSDDALFREIFRKVSEKGLAEEFSEEIERHHSLILNPLKREGKA